MVSILFLPWHLKLYLRASFFVWFYLRTFFFSYFSSEPPWISQNSPVSPSSLNMPCHSPSVSQNSLSFFSFQISCPPSFSKEFPLISHFLRIFHFPHHSRIHSHPSSLREICHFLCLRIPPYYPYSEFPQTLLSLRNSLRLILSLKFSQSPSFIMSSKFISSLIPLNLISQKFYTLLHEFQLTHLLSEILLTSSE